MSKKLFIGNLPYNITEKTLEDLFSKAGTVESVAIITDRISGRSKGFGFVEMASEEEAKKAMDTLNEKEVEGRNIVVNEARPRENRGFSQGDNFNQ